MESGPLQVLFDILGRLRHANIHCQLAQYRDDAVSIKAVVPGQRWEIDVLVDGTIEVEVFRSDGTILDERSLNAMISEFSD